MYVDTMLIAYDTGFVSPKFRVVTISNGLKQWVLL